MIFTRRRPQPSPVVDPLVALVAAFERNAWDWHGRRLDREAQVAWHFPARLRDAIEAQRLTPTA